MQLQQLDADTPGPPAGMEPTQLPAGVADGQAWLDHTATAAVQVGRKILAGMQRPPPGQQVSHGTRWQGQALGDVTGAEAGLVQVKDLLTQGTGPEGPTRSPPARRSTSPLSPDLGRRSDTPMEAKRLTPTSLEVCR